MHAYLKNCVAIGHAVVYYDWAAHVLGAGIKCGHCSINYTHVSLTDNISPVERLE